MLSKRLCVLQLAVMLMVDANSESVGSCSEDAITNATSRFLITFGCGSPKFSDKTPSAFNFSNNYIQGEASLNDAGHFGFVNEVPDNKGKWHNGASDHTKNDTDGYMYFVNVGGIGSQLFNITINGLCNRTRYVFFAYLANVVRQRNSEPQPNIRFEVRTSTNDMLAQSNTSGIPEHNSMNWSQHCVSFVASSSSIVLLMITNIGDIIGNNMVIDDIGLSVCSTDYYGCCHPDEATTSQPKASTMPMNIMESSTDVSSTLISSTQTLNTTYEQKTIPLTEATDTMSIVAVTDSTSVTASIMTTTQLTTKEQTSSTYFIASSQFDTVASSLVPQSTSTSVSKYCNTSMHIGLFCNVSNDLCDMLEPCRNGGTCNSTDNNQRYNCSCLSGFNGTNCEFDHRPCKPYTCLDHGNCNETSSTTFNCTCHGGWQGLHCESMINFCKNNPCLNRGVCRPLVLNYKCGCLDGYSGQYCENIARRIIIYQIVSKSLSYIAIIAIASVAMFVIIMDILKYCFGIDPVEVERKKLRREKQAKRPKRPVIERFVYVNAPPNASVA